MKISKYKAREVVENNWIREVDNGNIRKCHYCGYYVNVEDFSSEYEDELGLIENICEDCLDKHQNGLYDQIIYEENEYIEDYEEEE